MQLTRRSNEVERRAEPVVPYTIACPSVTVSTTAPAVERRVDEAKNPDRKMKVDEAAPPLPLPLQC